MRTLGPSTVPHQLQVAVIEVLIFGPTRKPAYAFPSMSLKRTMGAMSGAIAVVLRLPIQIAAGLRFPRMPVASGCTTPRIWFLSIRPGA